MDLEVIFRKLVALSFKIFHSSSPFCFLLCLHLPVFDSHTTQVSPNLWQPFLSLSTSSSFFSHHLHWRFFIPTFLVSQAYVIIIDWKTLRYSSCNHFWSLNPCQHSISLTSLYQHFVYFIIFLSPTC